MNKYEKTIRQWDEIFTSKNTVMPQHKNSGNTEFDKSLFWLIQKVDSIIDFGCADGNLLFLCSQYGTVRHIGIDLSSQVIANAREQLADVSGQQSFQYYLRRNRGLTESGIFLHGCRYFIKHS